MIDFTLNGEAKQLPENWQEVRPDLLPDLLRLLFVEPENTFTQHHILRLTLGYSKKEWTKFCRIYFGAKVSEERKDTNSEMLAFLFGRLSWMWTESLTVQPVEFVEIEQVKHFLPEPFLKTTTYGELTDAYIHLRAFTDQLEPGETRLHLLLATICRPEQPGENYQLNPEWNGDKREPYNEHVAGVRAKAWQAVPLSVKIPILVYFVGSLKELMVSYEIYETETIDNVASEEEYPGQGFIKNQHLLAEKGVFGTMKETRQAGAHEVLLFLEEFKKDEEYKEKKRKEAENKK
ncbi:hypothetical protein [Siphonobacter curvatus]|uniref:Uncharacterized protein n=1 Tax=Siphonobacter curvatus TaxID=2094562 RepID=A0A2S7INH3_9BACT|nr:hypothetical protein [Siphonobacter curvatus]PQA59158.1 hypothetical protein C5O19_05745 [Siphonobacter curvatus]